MLLPRESLPLSALDLSQPLGDFPTSRLFESRIKILDLEGRLGSNVLLARSETTRMVYAVERESNGLYVLCKLGSWVDIEALAQNATVVCAERMRSSKPSKSGNTTATPLTTPSMYNETKRRRLAIEEIQSLVRKRSMSVIEKNSPSQTPGSTEERPPSRQGVSQSDSPVQEPTETSTVSGPPMPAPLESAALDLASNDDALAQPTAEDIFQNLRTQYMEALYHSKVRLSSSRVSYSASADRNRARWRTLQRALFSGLERHSMSIGIAIST
jgi:DNA replication regulator SLD3